MAFQQLDEEAIFKFARKIGSPEDRGEYLQHACRDDTALLARVEALLEVEEKEPEFLNMPPSGVDATIESSAVTERPGTVIGKYTLREQIGEGGMGVVYVAQQTEPVQRKVALKVIKPGMDTKEVIARFEAERQALAFMEHPNIARVLDAGATENGRSYFVMELVRGIPITEYCNEVKASPHERLELFKTVCEAVQHAHQKGIIHRDIKPSNVLVTQVGERPVVKVIDFGLAKATSGQRLTERTVYTGFMRLVGTPVYMSPEQAGLSNLDIDTRADIYSLGVLLYELLTGTTPLDKTAIEQSAYEELCRQVREVEAPKPSARVSTMNEAQRSSIATQRKLEPNGLRQLLHGDLDRVVLKALEKDRDRRYETPKDLAADVDRFLNDQPVLAVPPSQLYLARKYFRRHRVAIMTCSAIFMSLLLATAVSTRQAIIATRAEKTAETERKKAEEARLEAVESETAALSAREDAVQSAVLATRAKEEKEQLAHERRRLLYTSDMRLAAQLWESPNGDLRKIEELLTAWIPLDDSQEDLRDFTWRFQWTRLHKSAAVTVVDTTGATISAKGKLITADEQGIREWDESGELATPLWKGDASSVVFSTNGRWAAVTEGDTTKLIEILKKRETMEIPHRICSFSAAGSLVYGWTDGDEKLEIWKLDGTPEPLEPLTTDRKLPGDATRVHLADDGQSFLYRGVPHYSAVGAFLDRQTDPLILQNRNSNHSCAWSPDGSMVATGSFTGIAQVRLRADLFRNKWMIGTHGDGVGFLRFSPDGRTLATGGRKGAIDLWDVAALHELSERGDNLSDLRSPSAHAPKFLRTIKGHLHGIKSIDFSPDGKRIVSFDGGGVSRLWDLQRVDGRYEIESMAENLLDGRTGIRWQDSDEGVVVKEINPPRHNPVRGTVKPGDRILSLTEERSGATTDCSNLEIHELGRLLLGPADSLVRLELTTDGKDSKEVVVRRQKVDPRSFQVAFAPDNKTLAVGDMRLGTVSLNLETGATKRLPMVGISVAISPIDGRLLAVSQAEHIRLWDLKQNHEFDRLELFTSEEKKKLPGSNGVGGTFAFSPDGQYFAVGTGYTYANSDMSNLKVWRVGARGFEEIEGPEEGGPLFRHTYRLGTVVFTPDSSRLIVGDWAGKVRVWRTSDWRHERTIDAGARVWGLAITPDGKTLATGGGGSAVLWDFQSGEKLKVLSMPEPMVLAFSPDGKTLVSGSRNHLVVLWDVGSGRQLRSFHSHQDAVCGAAFSPDGKTLATAGTEGVLRLWKASTFEEIESSSAMLDSLFRLGQLRNQQDRFEEAEAILCALSELQRRHSADHTDTEQMVSEITRSMAGQGDYASAIAYLDNAIRARGDNAGLYEQRGNLHARRRHWKAAAEDLTRAIELDPDDHWNWFRLSPLLVENGDADRYREHCREVVVRFKDAGRLEGGRVIQGCILLPDAVKDWDEVLARSSETMQQNPMPTRASAHGTYEFRRGNDRDAIDWIERRLDSHRPAPKARAMFPLAMAYHRLGQLEQALAILERGEQVLRAEGLRDDLGSSWHDFLCARILRREAAEMIRGPAHRGVAEADDLAADDRVLTD